MDTIQDQLFSILNNFAAPILVVGSIFLSIRGRHNKAMKYLASVFLYWGLFYVFAIFAERQHMDFLQNSFFNAAYIITAHIDILSLFVFPVEVLLPGWLNPYRILKILLPPTIMIAFYYTTVSVLGETTETFTSLSQFTSSFTDFNVWFRMIILFLNTISVYVLYHFVLSKKKAYEECVEKYYSNTGHLDISWMKSYYCTVGLILIPEIVIVISGSLWAFTFQTLIVIIGFTFLLYKALFLESPYNVDSFHNKDTEKQLLVTPQETVSVILPTVEPLKETSEISFESKIPLYVRTFKEWMEVQKPYLYKDFKLTDVSRALPLNRTYLSKVLNEGLGKNFSEIVRMYRVEYAKTMIQEHPDLPFYQVADLSGFSSDSTFSRAFVKETGLTPKQYSSQIQKNEK